MGTYIFDLPAHRISWRIFIRIFLLSAFISVGVSLCFHALKFLDTEPISPHRVVLNAIGSGPWFAIIYEAVMKAFRPRLVLTVSNDSMSAKWSTNPWSQVVHEGKVRSIFPIKGSNGRAGIGISERGRFAARMIGFLYLPESLPEYESLKALVETWRIHPRERM